MSELSKAQRIVQDLRSLKKMRERTDELLSNWIEWDYGAVDTYSCLLGDIDKAIQELTEMLEEVKGERD